MHKMMMNSLFRGLLFLHVVSSASAAVVLSCQQTLDLAEVALDQVTRGCLGDSSQCSPSACGDCLDGGESLAVECIDGCGYTFGDYQVARGATGSTFVGYLGTSPLFLMLIGYRNYFTKGAEGKVFYSYEPVVGFDSNNQTTLLPARQPDCDYKFNGNQCLCEQRYCTTDPNGLAANYVDCSQYEGGGVVDYCAVINNNGSTPLLTAESSLLEILLLAPIVACASPSKSAEDGSPVPAPGGVLIPEPAPGGVPSPVPEPPGGVPSPVPALGGLASQSTGSGADSTNGGALDFIPFIQILSGFFSFLVLIV
jgi:hypothetical protein